MTTLLALALVLTVGVAPAPTADGEEVLEGYLEVIVEDSNSGSRTLYFLINGDDRIPLRFVKIPPNLRTGTRVRVRGAYETGGRFVVVSFERVVPAG